MHDPNEKQPAAGPQPSPRAMAEFTARQPTAAPVSSTVPVSSGGPTSSRLSSAVSSGGTPNQSSAKSSASSGASANQSSAKSSASSGASSGSAGKSSTSSGGSSNQSSGKSSGNSSAQSSGKSSGNSSGSSGNSSGSSGSSGPSAPAKMTPSSSASATCTGTITGPANVPGLSQYTYSIDPNATNINWTVDKSTAILPSNVKTNSIVVQFQNSQPDYITLKATYTLNGSTLCAIKMIALVQIQIGNFNPTNPGTPPQPIVYNQNLQINTNNPIFVTTANPGSDCTQFKLTNGGASPAENGPLSLSSPGTPAAYQATQVFTMVAPDAVPTAVQRIQVGLIQTGNFTGQSNYGVDSTNNQHMLARLHNHAVFGDDGSLDWTMTCPPNSPPNGSDVWPWYDQAAMKSGAGQGNNYQDSLFAGDSPGCYFASQYNPNNHNIAAGGVDPNANANITAGQASLKFIIRVGVNTLDTDNQANIHYFAITMARWTAAINAMVPANAASCVSFDPAWTMINAVTEIPTTNLITAFNNQVPFKYDTQM